MVHDPAVALETLVSLGFERVLTSGCDTSALEGLPLIKRLVDQVCISYMYAYVYTQAHDNGMTIYLCCFVGGQLVSLPFYHSYILLSTLSSSQQAKGRIAIMPG